MTIRTLTVKFHKPTAGTFESGHLGEFIRSETWFQVPTPEGRAGAWFISPDGVIQSEKSGYALQQPANKELYKELYDKHFSN